MIWETKLRGFLFPSPNLKTYKDPNLTISALSQVWSQILHIPKEELHNVLCKQMNFHNTKEGGNYTLPFGKLDPEKQMEGCKNDML